MKKSLLLILLVLTLSFAYSQQDWTGYSISGAVRVWFPSAPMLMDTLGQQYAYVRENDEMMMANVAAVPLDALQSDTFSATKAVDRFVNDIIAGSTRLIYTDLAFKGIQAKYYKIRRDMETDPLLGLVVDGYCFFLNDTIYSFSYWRFKPGELFDYSRQRMFYDKIEITQIPASITVSDEKRSLQGSVEEDDSEKKRNMPAIMLGSVVAILAAVVMYQRFQQKRNTGD